MILLRSPGTGCDGQARPLRCSKYSKYSCAARPRVPVSPCTPVRLATEFKPFGALVPPGRRRSGSRTFKSTWRESRQQIRADRRGFRRYREIDCDIDRQIAVNHQVAKSGHLSQHGAALRLGNPLGLDTTNRTVCGYSTPVRPICRPKRCARRRRELLDRSRSVLDEPLANICRQQLGLGQSAQLPHTGLDKGERPQDRRRSRLRPGGRRRYALRSGSMSK